MDRQFPNRVIPFYSNPDNVSCGQCTYKMMLEYFAPDQDWNFEKMNALCGAIPGKATWPFKIVYELVKLDFDITFYFNFDIDQFIDNTHEYTRNLWGIEAYNHHLEVADFDSAVEQAKEYKNVLKDRKFDVRHKNYTIGTIRSLLDDGYLLGVWVDQGVLNNHEFAGHFILLHDYNEEGVIAHDSGSTYEDGKPYDHLENRFISYDLLMRATTDKDGNTDDLVAIRL